MTKQVFSISQINEYIRRKMDQDELLTSVAVSGEISNYKMYPSGHHYFTLKDEGSALKCVMFKSSAVRMKFRPENGMKVIAVGKISIFPRDGAYQLYCTTMTMDGVGDLYAAFEQLKARLSEKGLFDLSHKKPIPQYPKVIGLVTSSAGAAVHDMLRILRKRYPLTKVILIPVRVQGAEAPQEIAAAIGYANSHHLADLMIVGRGGGSIEDLWAFNDERVAYAIYESKIPIISAVGHEPDVTISDFVADLRAATPSNAAELAVPDQDALRQALDELSGAMFNILHQRLDASRRHLSILAGSPALQSPTVYLAQKRKNLTLLSNRIISAQELSVSRCKQRFMTNTAKLDAMSPLKVLTRGYTMTHAADGSVIRSTSQVTQGDHIHILLSDGSIKAQAIDVKENA